MPVSLVYIVACRLLALVLLLARGDRSKELELLVLRDELSILRRKARRPQLTENDRLVLAALSRVMPRRSWQAFMVTPETLLLAPTAHRAPVDVSALAAGRPPIDPEVRELIQRLARENGHWGYVRIVGELRKLGIRVSATLVRNVRHGLAAAAVRAVLRLDRDAQDRVRRLHAQPGYGVDDAAAFNLVMDLDDRGQRPRFLIHDRDKKFSRAFDAILRGEGITIIRTPIQAPKANACAERSVGSARRECLDRLLIFGHRQLEHVLRTYIRRFNEQRPHRALDLRPPDRQGGTDPPPTATVLPLRVRRRDLLGGPLHEYEAAA